MSDPALTVSVLSAPNCGVRGDTFTLLQVCGQRLSCLPRSGLSRGFQDLQLWKLLIPSSSLRGKKYRSSREELGPQPVTLPKGVAPVEVSTDRVAFDIQFGFFSSSFGYGEGPALLAEQSRGGLLVEWNS